MSEQDVLDKIEEVIGQVEEIDGKLDDAIVKINETKAEVLVPKTLKKICHHCKGTGTKPGWSDPEVGCPDCNSTGYRPFGKSE